MHPGIVARVFRDRFDAYARGRRLCRRQYHAAHAIATCRTAAQGVRVERCPEGHFARIRYNSCRHRSCPGCGWTETERWVRARGGLALACPCHHVIFTVPDTLRALWQYNRRRFTNLLFAAAWGSLSELLGDTRWLGAMPGAIAVFQSWSETLSIHAHVHMIVTAGGLSPAGDWLSARKSFLLPSRVLRDKFRGKLRALLLGALDGPDALRLPSGTALHQMRGELNRLGRIKWNVRIQPVYDHMAGVIRYLAFYVRRGPISERRISAYDGDSVTIATAHTRQPLRLAADEFIARFLEHVPPANLRVVRTYGLFHHHCRLRHRRAGEQLAAMGLPCAACLEPRVDRDQPARAPLGSHLLCPLCALPLQITRHYAAARDSPVRIAA